MSDPALTKRIEARLLSRAIDGLSPFGQYRGQAGVVAGNAGA